LAVFLNAEHIPENQMQKIAAEINFAESTFITKMNPDEATAEIRIFTPVKEMQFAGHPIGTSWVLMNKIFNNPQKSTVTVPIGPIQFTNQKV
jgi:trans-2,3-dihydro-3-hydroxyanthranilate isomerase